MNDNTTESKEETIDLSIIFFILIKYIVFIVLFGIVCGTVSFYYTKYFIPNKYKATATVIVNYRPNEATYVYPSDIVTSRNLAELYSIIIKSDQVLQKVIDDMDLDISYEQLKNMITVRTVDDTQVVEISTISSDADFAVKLVNSFVENSKPIILEKVDAGSVKDLNAASLSNNGYPISPNRNKNTMTGVLFGCFIAFAFFLIKELLNNQIETEEDVVNVLKVPMLGMIPLVDRKDFGK